MEYESHPNKPLREHLAEVAEGARVNLNHPALCNGEVLRKVAWLVGFSHDFGKYTSYFQEHLHKKRSFEGRLENHGFLSAIFAAWAVSKRSPNLPDAPTKEFLPLLAYAAVHRHHGNLRSVECLVPNSLELKHWPEIGPGITGEQRRALAAFKCQLEDLKNHREEITADMEKLKNQEIADTLSEFLSMTPNNFYELFRNLHRLCKTLNKNPGENDALSEEEKARLSLWEQLLFSALIDADKFSASGLKPSMRPVIPSTLVEDFLKKEHPSTENELNCRRAAFQQVVRQQIDKTAPVAGRIFSLTAPTGMGKTYAALDASLRLRKKFEDRWGTPPRIIYALPFVNIINQNYEEFKKVLELLPEYAETPERFMIRHHYLAEISYRQDNENMPLEKALLMTESWESEIIVTTFVQLFNTIIGYRNRFLKKLHNLIGAIVILDEVQTVPVEYWLLTANVFKTLCREMGITVIQMTATKPLIFNDKKNIQEIYPDPSELFIHQDRTRLNIESEKDLESWSDEIDELYQKYRSLLVVVNTIGASLQSYRLLKTKTNCIPFGQEAPKSDEEWIVYLSTNITPKQRTDRLEAVSNHLKNGGRALVISTQIIEAGVNLDFPAVVRDIGPLDSIVQVAGRCNREGKLNKGEVYLIPLQNGGCSRVYGPVHYNISHRILSGRTQVEEQEYAKIVADYFDEVKQNISQNRSKDLWKAYCDLRYDNLNDTSIGGASISEFSLIESPEQVPVFVALNERDESWLLNEFKVKVLLEKDVKERRNSYIAYRKDLHELTIRPLLQRAFKNMPPYVAEERNDLRWIPYEQLSEYYDLETGFKWDDELSARIW